MYLRPIVLPYGLVVLDADPHALGELSRPNVAHNTAFAEVRLSGLHLAPRTYCDVDLGSLFLFGLLCTVLRKAANPVPLLVRKDGIYQESDGRNCTSGAPMIPCLWAYSASLNSNLST